TRLRQGPQASGKDTVDVRPSGRRATAGIWRGITREEDARSFGESVRADLSEVRLVDGKSARSSSALTALTAKWRARLDTNWVNDCRTLLSVDDQVGRIVGALSDTGRLADTLILFASDNGFMFGEHRWVGKIVPYEESARVPVVVRDDTVVPPDVQGTTVSDQTTSL